jgi:hypothetical protein
VGRAKSNSREDISLGKIILQSSFVPHIGEKDDLAELLKIPSNFFLLLRIRIHRIHMFLGLPDPDPLVRGMDPDPSLDPDSDPSIIMQK